MAYTSPQAFVFYYYFLHAFESIKSVKSVVAGKAGNSDAALADISFSCSFSFRSLNFKLVTHLRLSWSLFFSIENTVEWEEHCRHEWFSTCIKNSAMLQRDPEGIQWMDAIFRACDTGRNLKSSLRGMFVRTIFGAMSMQEYPHRQHGDSVNKLKHRILAD